MSITATLPPANFDPLSDAALETPASLFPFEHEAHPLFFYEPLGGWMVTQRGEVERVLQDVETFSSTGYSHVPVPPEFAAELPPELFQRSLIAMDPPDHTLPRKIGQRGFMRPRMEQLAPMIEQAAHRLVDQFAARGRCDLLSDYALALTGQTLVALMDLPQEMIPFLMQIKDDHLAVMTSSWRPLEEPNRTVIWKRYVAAHRQLRHLVEQRTEQPGDDIISTMAAGRDSDGRQVLSRDRVAFHIAELCVAAIDTTANLIAHAAVLLTRHPNQLAAAQGDASLWPAVVEETLRRHPSTLWVPRLATRETEIAGVGIGAGDLVWLALVAANNDPADHDCPERFNIHRPTRENHLAFGKGRHFCMGAPLARIEAQIGLRVLYERLPDLQADLTAPPRFNKLVALLLRTSLPVRWSLPPMETV